MIDIFSILLTHGLMLLAAWRLYLRDDLDVEKHEPASSKGQKPAPKSGWGN